jgi:hypothetical protein
MLASIRCSSLVLCLAVAACAAPAPPPSPPPAPPPVPAAPPPPPRIEAPNFTGLAPEALRARLGNPQFSRKDGPTEMWRYDSRSCSAIFFFTGNQVSRVETLPAGLNSPANPACLISLRKAAS